jgi:4-amino-4-deoxy-L-arabinose transferase-like glycosyltransferase
MGLVGRAVKLLSKPPLVIFSLALLMRLIYLVFHDADFVPGDARNYTQLAVVLTQGQGYVDSAGIPTSERPPLYPFFLALIFFLFGQSLPLVKLIQALTDAGTCALVYALAKRVFDDRVAWISGLLSVFHLSLIFAVPLALPETLMTFLVLSAVLYVSLAENSPSMGSSIAAGCLLALAALTRGTALVFPLFVLLYFFWLGGSRLPMFKKWLVISASFLFVILPWTLRNYQVHHALVPIATQAGRVFYSSYILPQGKIMGVYTSDETVTYARSQLSEAEASRFLFGQTLRRIADDPSMLWYLSFLKLAYLASPFDWELSGGKGIYNFSYAFILPFALWGIYVSLKEKKGQILLLPLVQCLFVSLLFYGSPRLRLSVEPFLIVFAASVLHAFFEDRRRHAMAVRGLFTFYVMNVAAYFFSNDVKSFASGLLRGFGLW